MRRNISYNKTIPCLWRSHAFAIVSFVILTFCNIFPLQAKAGPDDPDFDELLVFVNVQNVGGTDIPAVVKDNIAYLSVQDVFDFLKIKSNYRPGSDTVSGFFINEQATFLIDKSNNRIFYKQEEFKLNAGDIITTETNFYLRLDYFGKVFGLDCKFNFRTLSISLSTNIELPVIAEMRQKQMRDNLNRIKGETKADTTFQRTYPAFRFGMADWSVVVTQNVKGTNDTRANLALGGVIAGGETNISLNYDNNIPLKEKDQFYQWRYVNNNTAALRQVAAGRIITSSVSSIYSPVSGIQFTNAPTLIRRSFGTYPLSNYTQPNWTVELYVNDVLINYVKADASGFYKFDVPLMYGSTVVKLRFYSPWGEERTEQMDLVVPFNFLPERQFQYTVTGGFVEDSVHSKFARAAFNYGVNKYLTMGTGIEYLSSVTSGKFMPYVNAFLRLPANILLVGDYTYGVRTKFLLSYRRPSNFGVEVDYTKYKKGQTAINNTFLEERKLIVNIPFRKHSFSAFSRFTIYQAILPSYKNVTTKYTTAEGLLSAVFHGINANITGYALFTSSAQPYVYTNIAATIKLPGKLFLTPQCQYEFNSNKIISVKSELGKYLSSKGYANLFYENNIKSGYKSIGIGLRYDFSISQIASSARHSSDGDVMTYSARGGLIFDNNSKYVAATNRANIGRGGIFILPYLDLNANGIRDKGEPKVEGLKVQITGGRITYNNTDTTIRISDLDAYMTYNLKLRTEGFENVMWQIKNKNIDVVIDPNQFKLVEIPVSIINEVSGMVYLSADGKLKEQSRILIDFYRADDHALAGETLSEQDGFFSLSGLAPGSYIATINQKQKEDLQLISSPKEISFIIKNNPEGDVVDDLKFILEPVKSITVPLQNTQQ